jgi:flagellar protein FliO/FliZ
MSAEPLSLAAVLQIVTALALVTALIVGAAWAMRRFGRLPAGGNSRLRMIGGIHLGQRERIIVLQAGDEQLVIGVTPGCIRTLHVMPQGEDELADPAPPGPGGFLGRLNRELAARAGR